MPISLNAGGRWTLLRRWGRGRQERTVEGGRDQAAELVCKGVKTRGYGSMDEEESGADNLLELQHSRKGAENIASEVKAET